MKRKILIKGIIIVLLLSFVSCNKPAINKYTGNWKFIVERTKSILDSIGMDTLGNPFHYYYSYEYDTSSYLGTISTVGTDYELNINYAENKSVIVGFTACGKVPDLPRDYSFASGQFEGKDSLILYFVEDSGRDYLIYCDVYGKKIKK